MHFSLLQYFLFKKIHLNIHCSFNNMADAWEYFLRASGAGCVTQQFKPTETDASKEQSGEDEENNDVSSPDNFCSFSFSTNKPVPLLAFPHDVGTLLCVHHHGIFDLPIHSIINWYFFIVGNATCKNLL